LEPIWYNEGKRKNGSFFFIFLGQCIHHYIVFSLLVNDLIIISKELSQPFFFLLGGNVLFQKVIEALMVDINLEALPQEISVVYPFTTRFTQNSQLTIHYMDLKTNAFNQN
jgi:hypothetical protein